MLSLSELLKNDDTMMAVLACVCIPILGIVLYLMDEDGGAEKAKVKQAAAVAKEKAKQEERATYDLTGRDSNGAEELDARVRRGSMRIALGLLCVIALGLVLWIERTEVIKLEQEAERELSMVRELLTMRQLAPFLKDVFHHHPIAAEVAVFGGGLAIIATIFVRMPGEKALAAAAKGEDKKGMMPS